MITWWSLVGDEHVGEHTGMMLTLWRVNLIARITAGGAKNW
jgi:hypothetical protein